MAEAQKRNKSTAVRLTLAYSAQIEQNGRRENYSRFLAERAATSVLQ